MATGKWNQVAKLESADPSLDYFGWEVAIADERIAVTVPRVSGPTGQVHVYQRNASGQWQPETILTPVGGQDDDFFGGSVAISGPYIVVGALRDNVRANGAGAVYVFERSGAGDWTQVDLLYSNSSETNQAFGAAVAIDDGSALIGAPGDPTNGASAGAAYFFEHSSSGRASGCRTSTTATARILHSRETRW